jgi:hypothetical protein
MDQYKKTVTLMGHDMTVSCDRSFSVANWFRQILKATPRISRRSVLLGLVHALLQLRSPGLPIKSKHVPQLMASFGGLTVGSIFYLVTDAPALRHFQACKDALSLKRQPVLVVPACALDRAHQLRRRRTISLRVPILSLETLFAASLVFETVERNVTMPKMWQMLISEYNRGAHDVLQPTITLEWSGNE